MKRILLIILLLFPLVSFGQYKTNSGINQNGGFQLRTSGYVFSAEALQYFARMPVKPANDTLMIIAEFIDSLVLNGVWSKLDASVLCANRDTTSALLNMKGTSFTGISIGAPSFVPYKGFTPAANKYINSLFNPSTAGGVYTQNSASFGAYSSTDYLADFNTAIMGVQVGGWSAIFPYFTGAKIYAVANGSGYVNIANAHTVGLISVTRTASNSMTIYIETDSIASGTGTSTAPPNGNFYVGADNNGAAQYFSPRQIPYYYIGSGFSPTDNRNHTTCLVRMLVKLGTSTLTRIVCAGNSLTGVTPNYPTKLQDTLSASSYQIVNKGIGGQSIEQMNTRYPSTISILPIYKKNVLIYWEGINSIMTSGNPHADSIYREMKRYGLQARGTGKWDKIIVMTTLPFDTSNVWNKSRDTLNGLLISHYAEFCDTVIDLCADANIGQWGDQLNTTFYTDKVHPTDAGQAIVMRMVYTALKNLKVIN